MCTIGLSSTATMETFATFDNGTVNQMGVGLGVSLGASDGAYGVAPFGGVGTLSIANVSGGGGIYFGIDGDSQVDSFVRENTGNSIAWTLGTGGNIEFVNHSGTTVLFDINVTNANAVTIAQGFFLPGVPTSGGTKFVCATSSNQIVIQSGAC